MVQESRAQRAWKQAALALIVLAAGIVAYHPHYNVLTGTGDPFPVHADEYVHWGYAEAIAREGTVAFTDPFTGDPAVDPGRVDAHERGFQAFLAVLQTTTAIPWPALLTALPAIVAMLTTLAIYVAAQRWNAGLATALWFVAVPTSLRFLGPAFNVPIAFSLPFIAFAIWLVFGDLSAGALAALLALCFGLWTIHTMAGAIVTLLAAVAGLLMMRLTTARAFALLGVAAIPFLVAHGQVERLFAGGVRVPTLPAGFGSVRLAGIALYVSAAAGIGILAASRQARERAAGTTLGILILVLAGVVLYRALADRDLFRAYDRSTLILAFLACFAAGVALARLRTWALEATKGSSRWRSVGIAAATVLVLVQVVSVAQAAQAQMEQEYYVTLTPAQHDAYVEASEKLGPLHQRAIVGGGPTMPFTIITGLPTLNPRSPETSVEPPFVTEFFRKGADDTRFLIETGTTVVVTQSAVRNPDLYLVAPGVYALREDYVERMFGPR